MTRELDGRELATQLREDAARSAERLSGGGVVPTLAILLATDDGGAKWYSRSIQQAAARVGIECELISLAADSDEKAIAETLERVGSDTRVHGIIVQTPLPPGVDGTAVATLVPPAKDIDGASPVSAGRLVLGAPTFVPATADAVMRLLRHHEVELSGKEVVVAGRSAVVGKPVAHLLLAENATVTICHSRTVDLPSVTSRAEVFVAAVGRPKMFTAEYVREGATVIDVGTNETDDGLVGDVDADAVAGVAGALTPVPGGVGPVTTAVLLQNVVRAAEAATASA